MKTRVDRLAEYLGLELYHGAVIAAEYDAAPATRGSLVALEGKLTALMDYLGLEYTAEPKLTVKIRKEKE